MLLKSSYIQEQMCRLEERCVDLNSIQDVFSSAQEVLRVEYLKYLCFAY